MSSAIYRLSIAAAAAILLAGCVTTGTEKTFLSG